MRLLSTHILVEYRPYLNLNIKVTKILYHWFLLLDQFRFCETYFTTYQRFVADQSAISPFLGGHATYIDTSCHVCQYGIWRISHVTYTNESRHIYWHVVSWMSIRNTTIESCLIYEGVTPHIQKDLPGSEIDLFTRTTYIGKSCHIRDYVTWLIDHVIHMNDSHHIYKKTCRAAWYASLHALHVLIRLVTCVNESYDYLVMSHMWMRHTCEWVKYVNESHHTSIKRACPVCE